MAQNTVIQYRCYQWDISCSLSDDFLNGLRNDFRDKGYRDFDLAAYVSMAINRNIDRQHVLLYRNQLTGMLGAMIAFEMTGKIAAKRIAYDAIMNMWEYISVIELQVYMKLHSNNERRKYLTYKRREFFQWYFQRSAYDITRFCGVLREVLNVAQYIFFEPDKYTIPVVLMSYISFDTDNTDRV